MHGGGGGGLGGGGGGEGEVVSWATSKLRINSVLVERTMSTARCDTHNVVYIVEVYASRWVTRRRSGGESSAFALDQPKYYVALDLAALPGLGWSPVQAQFLFLAFRVNHNFHLCAAHAKRTIRSVDLISAVVLRARNKSECATCRLQNHTARRTRPIVYELVEQDLGGRSNSQIGVIEKHQVCSPDSSRCESSRSRTARYQAKGTAISLR